MKQTVPSVLPGALTLTGWALILAGVFYAASLLLSNPTVGLERPLLGLFVGVYFGTQQLGLAGVLTRLDRRA